MREWQWPGTEDDQGAKQLERRHGMPAPIARILVRRGLVDDDDLQEFLTPRLGRLADPTTLADMDRAVERVWRAVDDGETIFVHGDYDVDGMTGTAFLTRTLRAVGADVVPYVPRRADGYGLGDAGIGAAVDAGAKVLITVDTGVRAFEQVEQARSVGIDVVVLDHHEPGDGLPDAYAVVNPLRGEAGDAFRYLAGVGVAAKFMHAVAAARTGDAVREAYREALQLVALGTIADVVPLTGENRILVAHGLRQLSRSQWAGVKALKAMAGIEGSVRSTDVAFSIAPRLNAAVRMGEARDALALLLTDDPADAFRLAEHLEALNKERRSAERNVLDDALAQVNAADEPPAAVVLWSDTWPVGVLGVVASRLLERLNRPVFLIAMDGALGRGSARSREGFPLPAALSACDELLREHGGHAAAAGFGIHREALEAFRTRIETMAAEAAWDSEPVPLAVDAAVTVEEVNPECVSWVERLSPFGRGNPEPLFGTEGLVVADHPSVVGKRHLRLAFRQGSGVVRAIAFNQGERVNELDRGQKVDAVFHAEFDTWRGGQNIQLVVRDLRTR